MTAASASRARMNRPAIDAERLRRRTKALTILAADHWPVYVRRCERQGYPTTTPPAALARFEVAQERQVELLNEEVG